MNPLTPYLKIADFALEPILKVGFAVIAIGVVMIALGYDPIGLAVGWIEQTIRSIVGL